MTRSLWGGSAGHTPMRQSATSTHPTTDAPALSPRAIEGFYRRDLRKRAKAKQRRVMALLDNKPSLAAALSLLRYEDGLLVLPIGAPRKWKGVRLATARRLYRKGLVRFESTMDGHRLWLTAAGRAAGKMGEAT